jgi:hypothetical protein
MDLRIELTKDRAICWQEGQAAFAAPLKDFVAAIGAQGDPLPLPEAIPDGVRFLRSRGPVTVLVMEDLPQVRTVRWLADHSPAPFGNRAVYRSARLAFPFVIIVVAFRMGALTGYQQCYYRTSGLCTRSDQLLLPNLYNVASGYRQQCWLCLANIRRDLGPLSWNDKVREIRRHMWAASFNKSSDVHEGNSFWQTMRGIDRRVQSLDAWEEASRQDPFFPLTVKWRAAGCNVGDLIDGMLDAAGSGRSPETLPDLVRILGAVAAPAGRSAGR